MADQNQPKNQEQDQCAIEQAFSQEADEEMQASERRAEMMKKNAELLEKGEDSDLARMLAEIEAKNKK